MKKETVKRGKSIAHHLNANSEKIFSYEDDIPSMKKCVLRILATIDPESNPEVVEARQIFEHMDVERNTSSRNHFLSTLVTYMTGCKVGR